MNGSDKQSSLPLYRMNYDRKKFLVVGPDNPNYPMSSDGFNVFPSFSQNFEF